MRHPCGTLFAALCCTALQPAFHRARAKRRATEDELWADTGGDDLELAGLDDVDSLDRYKRRCAACAQLCVARRGAPGGGPQALKAVADDLNVSFSEVTSEDAVSALPFA